MSNKRYTMYQNPLDFQWYVKDNRTGKVVMEGSFQLCRVFLEKNED